MRILHVIPSFFPAWRAGGPLFVAHGLVRALARAGHEVAVFTGNRDGAGILDVPTDRAVDVDGASVRYFPVRGPLGYAPAMGAALAGATRAFDVVHIHYLFRWHTSAASRHARAARVPYLLRPAGSLSPACIAKQHEGLVASVASRLKKRAYLATLGRVEIGRSAGLHFATEGERDGAAALGLRCPAFVVPPGVAPPDPPGIARRGPVAMLLLARLDPIKGFDLLLPALRRLRGDFELRLAGSGPCEDALRRTVARLGLRDRVRFLGGVTGDAKWQVLHSADLFVLPSHHENFGLSVLEAMAAGLPVVISDRVELKDVVGGAGAGLVVPRTEEALAAALQRLIDDPALRRAMGARGAAVARERFSWERVAREMEAVYETVSHSAVRRTPSARSKGQGPQTARVGARS